MKRTLINRLSEESGAEAPRHGRTIFRSTGAGFMDLGLRPVQVWEDEVMRERTGCEKEFMTYIKRCKGHKMTPGTAAGMALSIAGYQGYALPHSDTLVPNSNPTVFRMNALAECSSPFFKSFNECWKLWCGQRGIPRTDETLADFIDTYRNAGDLPLAYEIINTTQMFWRPVRDEVRDDVSLFSSFTGLLD